MTPTMKVLLLAIVLLVFVNLIPIQQVEASPGDARHWYLKYQAEKKTTKKLKRQVRIVRSGRSRLQREAIPWVNLSMCETGGRWTYNGASGFDGGLQFLPRTWSRSGGRTFARYAWQATAIQQAAIAQKVLRSQGRKAWPSCTRKGAW